MNRIEMAKRLIEVTGTKEALDGFFLKFISAFDELLPTDDQASARRVFSDRIVPRLIAAMAEAYARGLAEDLPVILEFWESEFGQRYLRQSKKATAMLLPLATQIAEEELAKEYLRWERDR
ncbi:MAG TPA: DUF2059 domain-containing protein [Thermoguttaceae bacterium]|nr:DUF2059 domain-containing protein [Thermoguttaceae bacterium]